MGLLDFDEHYTPPYKHQKPYRPETGVDPMLELNNLGHEIMSDDYADEIRKL